MELLGNKSKQVYLWMFLFYMNSARPTGAALLDWFWPQKNTEVFSYSNGPLVSVPFEFKTEDEKFIEEASKFTDLMKTSSLDICQHKVILKIKTSCASMSEEDLAKLSVNLLNCQSEVDERKIFPCTDSMSLKECTKDMDANTWNAYHLMNNRARAVCLAARKSQFQALSEMTINKLMATTHDQINKMSALLDGQEKLESLTLNTLASVENGHAELIEQQENLKAAQKTVQDFVTFNLEQLTQEKALIAAGNKALAKLTESIKEKLDAANNQLNSQAQERAENHKMLLQDLQALQQQARDIFQKIDISTEKLLMQHEIASLRYKDAVTNLVKINDTVHYLLKIINTTRNEIDVRFYWIQDFLDGTGSNIERLSSITFHIAYLLVGMLFASFLNFSTISRAALACIVPLNLFVNYNHGSKNALDFSQMTAVLLFTFLATSVFHKLRNTFNRDSSALGRISSRSKAHAELTETEGHRSQQLKSSKTLKVSERFFSRVFYNVTFSLNQLLSFAFGWVGRKSSKAPGAVLKTQQSNESNACSNFPWEKTGTTNTDNDYSFARRRNEESLRCRVNEWLQTKVDYSFLRAGTPSSSLSGSKVYCSATCRTGRRCKNVTSPGRDVCHRHLTGTSISG